jgi:hypothetical protein
MFWRVASGSLAPKCQPVSPGVMFWNVLDRRVGFAGSQMSAGVTRCHVLARFGASRRVRRPPNVTRFHPVSCFGAFWPVAPGSIRSGSWVVGWDQPALRGRRPTSARNRPHGTVSPPALTPNRVLMPKPTRSEHDLLKQVTTNEYPALNFNSRSLRATFRDFRQMLTWSCRKWIRWDTLRITLLPPLSPNTREFHSPEHPISVRVVRFSFDFAFSGADPSAPDLRPSCSILL